LPLVHVAQRKTDIQFQRLLSDEMQSSDVRIADALLTDTAPRNFSAD